MRISVYHREFLFQFAFKVSLNCQKSLKPHLIAKEYSQQIYRAPFDEFLGQAIIAHSCFETKLSSTEYVELWDLGVTLDELRHKVTKGVKTHSAYLALEQKLEAALDEVRSMLDETGSVATSDLQMSDNNIRLRELYPRGPGQPEDIASFTAVMWLAWAWQSLPLLNATTSSDRKYSASFKMSDRYGPFADFAVLFFALSEDATYEKHTVEILEKTSNQIIDQYRSLYSKRVEDLLQKLRNIEENNTPSRFDPDDLLASSVSGAKLAR
jgi:hypothetical protein